VCALAMRTGLSRREGRGVMRVFTQAACPTGGRHVKRVRLRFP
jgi:hypothetical protein